MDSPKGMETHSARSFVPLLFEEARPLKKTARFKWEKFRQRLWDKRAWKEASLAALRDVREVQWIGRCIFVFVVGWILTLIWLLVLFALELPVLGYTSSTACHPDGQFDVYQEGYNLWDATGFFQITLAWGSFSFADAKIIDVVWDVVRPPSSNQTQSRPEARMVTFNVFRCLDAVARPSLLGFRGEFSPTTLPLPFKSDPSRTNPSGQSSFRSSHLFTRHIT